MKLLSKNSLLLTFLVSSFLLYSCADDNPFSINFDDAPPPYDTSQAVRDTTLAGDIQIYVIEEGEGPFEVVSRDQIEVQFTARTEDGRIIDSSYSNTNTSLTKTRVFSNLTPNPITPDGRQYYLLVEGLRKGLLGMKEGESRTIVIPPDMAFTEAFATDARRLGPLISPNVDLRGEKITYDVKLISIQ